MKFLLLMSLLFSPYDVEKYDPNGKFEIGKYYKHPYTQIIYVKDRAVLHDGSVVLIIENIQGRTCKIYPVCSFPATTKKGVWVEVELIQE